MRIQSALPVLLILIFGQLKADSLGLGNSTAQPGDTVEVAVRLNNSVAVRGLQFNVSASPADNLFFIGVEAVGRASGFAASGQGTADNVIVVAYSASGGSLAVGNDSILVLKYRLGSSAPTGQINLSLSGVSVSDENLAALPGLTIINGGITVSSGQPVATFTAQPLSGQAPLTVSLDASHSSDSDGTLVSYAWTFGDNQSGSGATTTHIYGNPGTYTITLTITDNDGNTASATRAVLVFAAGEYQRGDVNRDNKTDIFDLLELLGILGGSKPN